jgi:hypothetical protein
VSDAECRRPPPRVVVALWHRGGRCSIRTYPIVPFPLLHCHCLLGCAFSQSPLPVVHCVVSARLYLCILSRDCDSPVLALRGITLV